MPGGLPHRKPVVPSPRRLVFLPLAVAVGGVVMVISVLFPWYSVDSGSALADVPVQAGVMLGLGAGVLGSGVVGVIRRRAQPAWALLALVLAGLGVALSLLTMLFPSTTRDIFVGLTTLTAPPPLAAGPFPQVSEALSGGAGPLVGLMGSLVAFVEAWSAFRWPRASRR